jgi:hypothetical protein
MPWRSSASASPERRGRKRKTDPARVGERHLPVHFPPSATMYGSFRGFMRLFRTIHDWRR